MNQIRIPLFFSFYTLMFLAVPTYGNVFQMASLSFILLQNILTLMSLKRNKINTFKNSMNVFSVLLIFIIPFVSLTNNLFNPELYYVEYSILFFVVMFSIYIMINTIDFQLIINSFVCAGIAITATLLVVGFNDLIQALSMNIDLKTGLSRFSPLGLHPNLVGHIFGGFAVTFFCCMLYSKQIIYKIFFTILVGVSLLFCIAASSRGGLIASGLGIITVYALAIWDDKAKRRYLFLFMILVIVSLLFSHGFDKFSSYLSSILEFDSNERGVGSGLTGRTANWEKLVSTMFLSIKSVLLGNGLRSGGQDVMGYSIDNGYLNMFYETGLVLTVFFVILMIISTNNLRRSFLGMPNSIKAVALGLFVFILVESIVERYLLSIGNPVSLFLVFCILGLKNILSSTSRKQVVPRPVAYRLNPQNYSPQN